MPRRTATRTAAVGAPAGLAAASAAAPHLTPWDHLVLIGFQVKLNLQKGFEKWEADFRDPLKQYLMSRPEDQRELTAMDLIKVSIVAKGGQAGINKEAVQNSFINSLTSGGLGLEQLLTLFRTGALGVTNAEAIRDLLVSAGAPAAQFITPADPTRVTHELRWKVLTPSVEQGCGVLADLPERIHTASGGRLDDEDIALMLPQAAPVVEIEDPAGTTVAVRRRTPRNRP